MRRGAQRREQLRKRRVALRGGREIVERSVDRGFGGIGHIVSRSPMRGDQRITSPRCGVRSVSWMNELIEA